MNENTANRKIVNLINRVANIANAWLNDNDKHAVVNYFNSKIETEK